MRIFYVLTLFVLCGCQSSQKQQTFRLMHKPQSLDESLLLSRPEIVSTKGLITLTPEQKSDFLNYYHKHEDIMPNQRILSYMQQHLKSFNYYSDTLVASEALAQSSGNCLSLAILTKSLADVANVGLRYEMVRTPPVYQKSNDIILSSQHIRSVVYNFKLKPDQIPAQFKKSITIDYYPTEGTKTLRWVGEQEFFSLYYVNRAAESLAIDKVSDAYWYLKEALQVKPSNAQAISMMGLVHGRLGFDEQAEQWYQYGLNFHSNQFDLLKNYYLLLKRKGRVLEAQELAVKLSKFDTDNPFDWVDLGDDAFNNSNYSLAIKHYKKAIAKAKYLHEPYAGLARSYFKLGRTSSAYKAMKKAMNNTHDEKVMTVYQAKYDMLDQQLSNDE